jgi:hypothetical protein
MRPVVVPIRSTFNECGKQIYGSGFQTIAGVGGRAILTGIP